MAINYADIAVILILIFCVLNAGRRGITHFIVGITGNLISLFLSVTLHGKVSAILRNTPLFGILYERIRPFFGYESIEALIGNHEALSASTVTERILANDNSEIYKLFGVDTFADYVSSYIANMALNIISIVSVYVIISLIIKMLFRANVVFSRIPAVKLFNFTAGAIGGLIEGVLVIWILIIILVFFVIQGGMLHVYETLLTSRVAIYFYKYNIFLYAILNITA